jgi:choice-of-anchor A domain-containing protein
MRSLHLVLVFILVLGSGATLAEAGSLPLVGNYDVLTFGNFSGSSDAQGGIAVGGNATLTGFGLGSSLANSDPLYPYTLVVGGTLTYTNGTVDGGGIAVGGNTNLTNVAVYGNVSDTGALATVNGQINGTVSAASWNRQNTGGPNGMSGQPTAIASIVDFSSLQSMVTADSVYWGSLTQTGSVNFAYNSLTLTGTSTGLNVFDITAAQLQSATGGLTISAPNGSTVLVNVSGTSVSFPNTGYHVNGTSEQDVVFNFSSATTLSGSGGFYGSVLAPLANFTFNNGEIYGNVVVNSMSGSGQTEYAPFEGNPPNYSPVPEPASLLLMGSGMLLGFAGLRRSKRRAA